MLFSLLYLSPEPGRQGPSIGTSKADPGILVREVKAIADVLMEFCDVGKTGKQEMAEKMQFNLCPIQAHSKALCLCQVATHWAQTSVQRLVLIYIWLSCQLIKSNNILFVTCAEDNRLNAYSEMFTYKPLTKKAVLRKISVE